MTKYSPAAVAGWLGKVLPWKRWDSRHEQAPMFL